MLITVAVISIALCLTDKGEHSAFHAINKMYTSKID